LVLQQYLHKDTTCPMFRQPHFMGITRGIN
jgi:hypothetical protein